MGLQILLVWAKGNPSTTDHTAVMQAIADAQTIYNQKSLGAPILDLEIWGQVNLEEEGILPNDIGYTDDQDYVDARSADGVKLAKVRDFYLSANGRLENPVFVLFVVPPGELKNANGFALLDGYCAVLPVPTGVWGTADGHTYAHEIGHGLSLVHDNDGANVMYPFRSIGTDLSGNNLVEDQYGRFGRFIRSQHPSLVKRDA